MTDLKKHAKVLCRQRRQLSHRPSPDTFWLPKFGSGPRDGGVGEQRTCWSRSAQPAAAERRVPAPTCCRPLPPPTEPLAAPADCQLCSYSASSWTNRMAGTNCWQPCRWARHRVPIPRAGAKRCGPTLLLPPTPCALPSAHQPFPPCSTLQYAAMFVAAGQPGDVKKIQASVATARKVFRIMRVSAPCSAALQCGLRCHTPPPRIQQSRLRLASLLRLASACCLPYPSNIEAPGSCGCVTSTIRLPLASPPPGSPHAPRSAAAAGGAEPHPAEPGPGQQAAVGGGADQAQAAAHEHLLWG